MNTARNITIALALAAIGLSGATQAADDDRRERMRRDMSEQSDVDRAERRAERRADRRAERQASDDGVVVREERRAERRRHQAAYDDNDRVDRRQDRQRARIIEGRRSGELTRGEFRRLKQQQRKIGRMERRFNRDGFLSERERYRLERAQDHASRRIARLKHNDIQRGSGHRFAHSYRQGRGHHKYHW